MELVVIAVLASVAVLQALEIASLKKAHDSQLGQTWDDGWEALRLQLRQQAEDPRHPITRLNPWRS